LLLFAWFIDLTAYIYTRDVTAVGGYVLRATVFEGEEPFVIGALNFNERDPANPTIS
jgi:hypothetical protein